MRGFRASRAAQNVMSFRYNHSDYRRTEQNSRGGTPPQQQQQQQRVLPDWLRAPETIAREKELSQAKPVFERPKLQLIQGGGQKTPVAKTKKAAPLKSVAKKAKPKAAGVKAVKSTKSKTAPRKTARKAA